MEDNEQLPQFPAIRITPFDVVGPIGDPRSGNWDSPFDEFSREPTGGGAPGGALGALALTLTRPAGYTDPVVAGYGWVNWGHVNNRVPTNIADDFALSTGLKIWVAITTNGAHPVQVTSCVLAGGADVPADIGGTETTPPTTIHYLLGTVYGDGTPGNPWGVTNSGAGNLRVETYEVGTVCQAYDPGPPAIPASIKTTYAYRVVREGA